MRKSLGSKRQQLGEEDIKSITQTFGNFEVVESYRLDTDTDDPNPTRKRGTTSRKKADKKTFVSRIFASHEFESDKLKAAMQAVWEKVLSGARPSPAATASETTTGRVASTTDTLHPVGSLPRQTPSLRDVRFHHRKPSSGRVARNERGGSSMTDQPQDRARSLRITETKTEKLQWSVLRAKQVCGLKFRRQHPIGPFYADFACVSRQLVVEIDGGYHDVVVESDLRREVYLREQGWAVIRFSDADVENDPEAVAIGIAKYLGLSYDFRMRQGTGSGMKKDSPPRPLPRPTLPGRGCLEEAESDVQGRDQE